MKFIKIGDKFFTLETVEGKTTLVEATNLETEPTEFLDGSAFLATVDTMELVDFHTEVTAAQAAFTEARSKAAKTGAPADVAAMREAQAKFVVLNGELTSRATAISDAMGTETDIVDVNITDATPPNTPANEPGEGAPADPAGEGAGEGDEGGEGDPGEGGEGAPEGAPAIGDLVTAAATAAVMAIQANGRQAPLVTPRGSVRLDALTDGGLKADTSADPRRNARMIAASGQQVVDRGEEMTDDQFLQAFKDFESQFRGEGLDAVQAASVMGGRAPRATVARFLSFEENESTYVDHEAPEAFRAVRASAAAIGGHHPTIHADGSTCDSCVSSKDVKRDIPDTMLDEDPLGNILSTYPAPHCELEYYKALSLSEIDAGITVWDDAAKTAFCTARDAWYAALKLQRSSGGATPADPALYAAMKAAEKDCAIPSCAPKDTVKPIGMSVCLEYPLEMEQCNPELIPVYRAALNRRFIQRKNQRILGQIEQYNIPVTVDVAEVGGPFINADGDTLGAAPVVLEVISALLARGVMTERIQGGNYSLMVPFSMVQMLAVDEGKTVDKTLRDLSSYLGLPVTTLYEYTDGDQSASAILTGQGGPFAFNSLPATVKDSGTAVAFGANLAFPTDWKVYLQDMSDFFMVTRPDVTVGAQVTPDMARQNMVFGMFQETFFGVGKDGNHPSWTIGFEGLKPNGARVAGIRPV